MRLSKKGLIAASAVVGGGGSYDADFQQVLNQATSLGTGYEHPNSANLTLLNQLMLDLKSSGFFAKMDIIRVYAHNGGDLFGLINWCDPSSFLATITGTLTRSVTEGFTAGAGTSYISDNYIPDTDAINYGIEKCSFGYYKSGGQSLSTSGGHIRLSDDYCRLQPRRINNLAYYKVNNSVLSTPNQSDDGNHLWSVQYDSSLTPSPDRHLYKGGTSISSTNHGGTPALPTVTFQNCYNGNDKSAFMFIGDESFDEVGDVETAIETYLTALAAL